MFVSIEKLRELRDETARKEEIAWAVYQEYVRKYHLVCLGLEKGDAEEARGSKIAAERVWKDAKTEARDAAIKASTAELFSGLFGC